MEMRRPRHYWAYFIPGLVLQVTGVVGLPRSVEQGDGQGAVEGLAWICAGALLLLAASTQGTPSRRRLVWLHVAGAAAASTRLGSVLLGME